MVLPSPLGWYLYAADPGLLVISTGAVAALE